MKPSLTPSLTLACQTAPVQEINKKYVVAVDENMAGAIPFLEYIGHNVLRPERGQGDVSIHRFLNDLNQSESRQIVFFSRDRDFTKYHNRTYFLYFLNLPQTPTTSQMELARLVEMILETDLPKRDDPQFEIAIRHVFKQMDGNHVVEIESATPPTPPHKNRPTRYQDHLGAWWSYSHLNDDLKPKPPVAIFKCHDCQGVVTLEAILAPNAHHRTCAHLRGGVVNDG